MEKIHLEIYDDFGRPIEEPAKCSRCRREPAQEAHTCPFSCEIHENYDRMCDCCEDCTYECAMDI